MTFLRTINPSTCSTCTQQFLSVSRVDSIVMDVQHKRLAFLSLDNANLPLSHVMLGLGSRSNPPNAGLGPTPALNSNQGTYLVHPES